MTDFKYSSITFGTDGIRGRSGSFINNMLAFKLAHCLKLISNSRCVIGYDTRFNSKALAFQIASVLSEVNIDSEIVGVCPTSCIIYLSKLYNSIGIMISASHNPYYDNGIKVILNGRKLDLDKQKLITSSINNFKYEPSNTNGKILENYNIIPYINYLKKMIDKKMNYKIIVDNANGSNSMVSRLVLNDAFSNVLYINSNPNGYNINKLSGAVNPSIALDNIKKYSNTIIEYDYILLFDGDADRLIVCDKNNIYDGDSILYVISLYLKDIGKLSDDTVVLTTQSNLGTINSLKEKGIATLVSDVGDSYVSEALISNEYSIGAESSGHIIIRSALESGCGLISSIYLFKALDYFNSSLKELTKDLIKYPYLETNVEANIKDKEKINNIFLQEEIKKDNLKDCGKINVRASGTQDVIRINVCFKDLSLCNYYLDKYTKIVKELIK